MVCAEVLFVLLVIRNIEFFYFLQVAHEFNNLLTPIVLNLNVSQNQLHQPGYLHELGDRLKEAEEAALRAKNLTHRLLAAGSSPSQRLDELAVEHGLHVTRQHSVRFPGDASAAAAAPPGGGPSRSRRSLWPRLG